MFSSVNYSTIVSFDRIKKILCLLKKIILTKKHKSKQKVLKRKRICSRKRKLLYESINSKKIFSKEEKMELSRKTNLTVRQISKWTSNSRSRKNGSSKLKRISYNEDVLLNNFYETQSKYPNKEQLFKLATSLSLSKRQISQWFYRKRRKEFEIKLVKF